MLKYIKKKLIIFLGLSYFFDKINIQDYKINELREIIKERTEYHVDVHNLSKQNSHVILIGKYGKRNFIKCYNIPDDSFKSLIDHCRDINRYANPGKLDAHPEISACIKNEINFF